MNLRAEELAERIGKSTGAIRSWEAGRFSPKHNDVIKLAEVLQKPASWFYGEEEPEQTQVKIGDATIIADAATIDRIVESLKKTEPASEDTGPDPGVIELLNDEAVCQSLHITPFEIKVLSSIRGGALKTKDKAIAVIMTLRS